MISKNKSSKVCHRYKRQIAWVALKLSTLEIISQEALAKIALLLGFTKMYKEKALEEGIIEERM